MSGRWTDVCDAARHIEDVAYTGSLRRRPGAFVRIKRGTLLYSGLRTARPDMTRVLFLSKSEAYARNHAPATRKDSHLHTFKVMKTFYVPRKQDALLLDFLASLNASALKDFLRGYLIGSSEVDLPAARATALAFHGWAEKINSPYFSEVMLCNPLAHLKHVSASKVVGAAKSSPEVIELD